MDKAAAKTRVERIACRFACEMQQLQADGCPDFFCPVSFPCSFVSMQAVGWVEQVRSRYGVGMERVWASCEASPAGCCFLCRFIHLFSSISALFSQELSIFAQLV